MNELIYILAGIAVMCGLIALYAHAILPNEIAWEDLEDGIAKPERSVEQIARGAGGL